MTASVGTSYKSTRQSQLRAAWSQCRRPKLRSDLICRPGEGISLRGCCRDCPVNRDSTFLFGCRLACRRRIGLLHPGPPADPHRPTPERSLVGMMWAASSAVRTDIADLADAAAIVGVAGLLVLGSRGQDKMRTCLLR